MLPALSVIFVIDNVNCKDKELLLSQSITYLHVSFFVFLYHNHMKPQIKLLSLGLNYQDVIIIMINNHLAINLF